MTTETTGKICYVTYGLLVMMIGKIFAQDAEEYQILKPLPGEHLISSEHFVARWKDEDKVELNEDQIHQGLKKLENIWILYTDKIGFPKPYTEAFQKYKISINLSDEGWATGSGTGKMDPAMWLNYKAFEDPHALAHEFAHTLQFSSLGLRDSPYTGWFWECHAEWMAHQTESDQVGCSFALVNSPHIYYGSTRDRYANWMFLEFLKDKEGYTPINEIWTKALKPGEPKYKMETPLQVLARNMDWNDSQLGEAFGFFAEHNVTWDYKKGALYRRLYGSYADQNREKRYRTSLLLPYPGKPHTYYIPDYHAPQQYGYNLVKINLQPGATVLRVAFHGFVQTAPGITKGDPKFEREPKEIPNPDSDWRWSIVTVGANDLPNYFPLQTGSSPGLTVNLQGVTSAWLVVVATPTEYQKIVWDQMYYTIYRYPWAVTMEGGVPEGIEATDFRQGHQGAAHPNGGGWVESTAHVDASAYVGPEARVLDHAQVLGQARIEGQAIIRGNARVEGNAVVRDHAWVTENGIVSRNARIQDEASIYRGVIDEDAVVGAMTLVDGTKAHIHGHAVVKAIMNAIPDFDVGGTAQLLGDLELHTDVDKGVFYGIVTKEMLNDPLYGCNRTEPHPEVTVFPQLGESN